MDIGRIDPDIFFCSAYKFYGPHLGVALIKDGVAEQLPPYKLRPAPESGPERFETGTQNHEAIAGLSGALDGLAHLSGGSGGEGARQTMAMLAPIQSRIADWVEDELRGLGKVRVFRPLRGHGDRAPVVAFRVTGHAPADCSEQLRRAGLFITHGDLYASALAERVGVAHDGGWNRIGVAGYTYQAEAERLLDAIAGL